MRRVLSDSRDPKSRPPHECRLTLIIIWLMGTGNSVFEYSEQHKGIALDHVALAIPIAIADLSPKSDVSAVVYSKRS